MKNDADCIAGIRSGTLTGKAALLCLEESAGYLFHGTKTPAIEEFEPRQAYNAGQPHGADAIFATPRADIAIFAAVVKGRGKSTAWEVSTDDHALVTRFRFFASADALERASQAENEGWAYVFQRRDFSPLSHRDQEWIRYEPIAPVAAVRVGYADLLEPVEDFALFEQRDSGAGA